MNKFFELSFINHIRNNDDLSLAFDKCYEPLVEKPREILSDRNCAELEDILSDCSCNALHLAGVVGMELAIGVMNGTIEQTIE